MSDLEVFRYSALIEQNVECAQTLAKPQHRILIDDPASEFDDSDDAANSVKQLFGYLWDNPEVFENFSNKFLVQFCEE